MTRGSVAAATALRFRGLEWRSLRDPVTRAYTDAYFQDVVWNETRKASRFGRPFSLLRLRIDDFGSLRRTLGSSELGRWLERRIERTSEVLRATDLLAAADAELTHRAREHRAPAELVVLPQVLDLDHGGWGHVLCESPGRAAPSSLPVGGSRARGARRPLRQPRPAAAARPRSSRSCWRSPTWCSRSGSRRGAGRAGAARDLSFRAGVMVGARGRLRRYGLHSRRPLRGLYPGHVFHVNGA